MDSASLDADGQEQEVGRLYDLVRRSLTFGNTEMAHRAVTELLELRPESTTSQELLGDVLLAQGKREEAMRAYKRAVELEEANDDAEAKYAELALEIGARERLKEAMTGEDGALTRGALSRDPTAAALRSIVFPGLGQVYNGEYEKGIGLVVLAIILLVPAVQTLLDLLPALFAGRDVVGWRLWLGATALVLYPTLWVYSVFDAFRSCKAQKEEPV